MQLELMSYGATILAIEVPDKFGVRKNIVAGFDNLEKYVQTHPYVGGTIGRFANRIADGKFNIDGTPYALSINDPPNHLHGGFSGFEKKVWSVKKIIEEEKRIGIELSYISPDGEEGYPGTLRATTTILLTAANEVQVQFSAVTDKSTIVNLTNHSYFNLSAFESPTIHHQLLKLNAVFYLLQNASQIPTGELATVKNTAMDFSEAREIGDGLTALATENGYDHTFVINDRNNLTNEVAELSDPVSGRLMKVFTNQPGIHVYTANWWDGSFVHANGKRLEKHGAIALETQAFPDAPNHPNFASAILKPGATYRAETVFGFFTLPE